MLLSIESIGKALANYPGLLPFVVWPLLTAIVNLFQDWLAIKAPRLAKALQSSGLDVVGTLKAFAEKKADKPADPPPEPPAMGKASKRKSKA